MKIASLALLLATVTGGALMAADPPSVEMSNGQIKARIYLPDGKSGFYRSTRFDWSGMIAALEYKVHIFYGPWFHRIDHAVYDFNYDDRGVVAADFTAGVGPAEEFNTDAEDGYGYVYRKTIRLLPGAPRLVIEHSLKNTGSKPIRSTAYNHNFFTLDNEGPSEGLTITVPYRIRPQRPPTEGLLEARGNQLVYTKTLVDKDRGTAMLGGFGDTAKDYDIRVENKKLGAGYHVTGDRPLSNVALWSIRTVMAVEPYISISIEPGKEFTWTLTYDYFVSR